MTDRMLRKTVEAEELVMDTWEPQSVGVEGSMSREAERATVEERREFRDEDGGTGGNRSTLRRRRTRADPKDTSETYVATVVFDSIPSLYYPFGTNQHRHA